MDENLEEIIKIAWKAAPGNTEYYLSRYFSQVVTQLEKTRDEVNYFESSNPDTDDSESNYYLGLLQKEKNLEKKVNKLNRLISFLRGS